GVCPARVVGGVETRLDRGRLKTEHDRGEGHEQVDRELHEYERILRAVPLGQAGSDKIPGARRRQQQEEEQGGGPEIEHASRLSWRAISSDSLGPGDCHGAKSSARTTRSRDAA